MTDKISRLAPRIWALVILIIWGGLLLWLPLLHFAPEGLDEGAARALLLNWSISDQVASPVVVLGVPDFRALLFLPLGIYWPGSVIAAKVFTLLITFGAAMLFYKWSFRKSGPEVALIATGLFLIAPLTIGQIDTLGVAPYLLLAFAVGAWVEDAYDQSDRPTGGWFYMRLVLVAITASLHPAGLAYPAALTWKWLRVPDEKRKRNQNLIGFGATLLFLLFLQAGWTDLSWFANPLAALAGIFHGPYVTGEPSWEQGLVPAILILAIFGLERMRLTKDLLTTMLAISVLAGVFAADSAWALLAFVFVIFIGTPWLIKASEKIPGQGFVGTRGLVVLVLVLIASVFMRADRAYNYVITSDILSPRGEIIRQAAQEAASIGKGVRVISQWPGETMIVCRCDVLPLPPAAKTAEDLYKMVKSASFLVFDPAIPKNATLARHVAELSGKLKTVWLGEGGVIVEVLKPGDAEQDKNTALPQ